MFEGLILSESVVVALRAAAATRGSGQPLGTVDVLFALLNNDASSRWDYVTLHTGDYEQLVGRRCSDPEGSLAGRWERVPLTSALAGALAYAEELARGYDMLPVQPGLLMLALVADPASGATRTLVDGTELSHPELVDLVHERLVGGSLVESRIFPPWNRSTGRRHPGGRGAPAIGPGSPSPHGPVEVAPARETLAPPPPPSSPPQRGGGLRQRWDWYRVKSLLFGLALGLYSVQAVNGVPAAVADDGITVGLFLLTLAGVCVFYALRHLRRARDTQAVLERRRGQRQQEVDRGRNVATRPRGIDLTGKPSYSEHVVDVLREAEAAAAGVVARQHVVEALDGRFRVPTPVGDTCEAVSVTIATGSQDYFLTVSAELAVCLRTAEKLAQSYAMNVIEHGHLATALAYSVSGDLNDAHDRLRQHFNDQFDGIDLVLESDWQAPTNRTVNVAPPPRAEATQPRQSSLIRVAYLLGSILLLSAVGGLFADIPSRLADTRDLQQAIAALHAGRNEEAFRLFSEVAEREPDSVRALQGRACAAASAGQLDRWVISEHNALLSGLGLHEAGTCLDPTDREHFHIVVAEGLAVIFPTDLPSDRRSEIDSVLPVTRSDRQLVEVVTEASCAAGSSRLPLYGAELAGVALRLAPSSMIARSAVAERLRSCVQDWPPSEAREIVTGWVAEL